MASSIVGDNESAGFQIAPMVDVVFVLMLFFMACAGTRVNEIWLTATFARPPVEHHDVRSPIFVDVDAKGQVAVNNEVYSALPDRDLSRLTNWLKGIRDDYANDPVVILPTPDARHERLMQVLNACALAGVKDVSFQ